jgi:hypothetical protein
MDVIRRNVLEGLLVILGGLYVYVGIYETGIPRLTGILGGLIIVVAAFVGIRSRLIAGGLLSLGTIPLAIASWWSIVTPLIAVLALLLGGIMLSQKRASSMLVTRR